MMLSNKHLFTINLAFFIALSVNTWLNALYYVHVAEHTEQLLLLRPHSLCSLHGQGGVPYCPGNVVDFHYSPMQYDICTSHVPVLDSLPYTLLQFSGPPITREEINYNYCVIVPYNCTYKHNVVATSPPISSTYSTANSQGKYILSYNNAVRYY